MSILVPDETGFISNDTVIAQQTADIAAGNVRGGKLLSIVIPVYNVELYLKKCLDSIFIDNNFPEFNQLIEVIAINDGSTDSSKNILEDYAEKYPLTIIDQTNRGLSSARNAGIKRAVGKYIQFVDSDDFLFPGKLQKITAYLDTTSSDLIIFDYANFNDCDKKFKSKKTGCAFSSHNGKSVLEVLLKKDIFSAIPWNKIESKELLTKNDLFFLEGIINEDTEWGAKLFALAENVAYLNDTVYAYRHRSGSITDIPLRNHRSYSHNLIILDSLTGFINDAKFNDNFREIFYGTMLGSFWIVWINSHFEGTLNTIEKKYGYLMKYCKWNRKYIYRPLIKLIGIRNFYRIKYGKGGD